MKKVTKILLRVLIGILCFALVACIGVFAWAKINYRDYFGNSERSVAIPGLGSGFVPQGFEHLDEENVFLISGYMKDSSQPSRIYVVTEDGKNNYAQLLREDGTAYNAHCGGITVNGNYLYISSEGELSVFPLNEVLEQETATQIGSVAIGERVSFCTFHDGYLFTGAFYRAESYETPEYHHVTTPAGDENPALIWVYKADENAEFGIQATPVAAISVRDQVQGLVFTDDGKIVLSTSWGLNTSELCLYAPDSDRVGEVKGVPLYYLDSANLVETVKAPPMTEEMVFLDGRVYVLTESACLKYIFGNLIDGRNVFAYKFQ